MSKPKSHKAKRKPRKAKVKARVVPVKHVDLPPVGAVRVPYPPGIVPVILHDPVKRVVEIAPLPAKKKQSWWGSFFD